MRILWKLFVIAIVLSAVGSIVGLVWEDPTIAGFSIAILIVSIILGGVFSLVEYSRSFANVSLMKAELRTWSNYPKAALRLYTEKGRISIDPEKIEILVDPNAEVVLLTVGTGRYFNSWRPSPVIVTVPSEETKEKWQEKLTEAQKIAQERYEKFEEERRESKEDLLPKPDKIPTIRPIEKDC